MEQAIELSETVVQIRQELTPEIPLYMHAVIGADAVALVDGGLPASGAHIDRLLESRRGRPLRYLANTHAHHDHIGNFRRLRDVHGSLAVAAAGAVPWIEDVDRNLREFALHHPDLVPDTPELRAELASTYAEQGCPVDVVVGEGAILRLGGGVELEAFELPGHVHAELGWLERRSRCLILGDTVTGTDWPIFHGHLDPRAFAATLHKLRALIDERDITSVAMSHYAPREASAFRTLLDEVTTYLQRIWAVVREPLGREPVSLEDVWLHTCRAMGKEPEFRSVAMVRAHLDDLLRTGEIRRVAADLYVAA
ncbi:MBL fold metallo-hydrolase [Phytoactinopolyspora halotolerans]|uniref:MBL fold metallo-hydrolase n=1 Tax=Phytoactinopolyspora halotolerans TaxID=1981512 RepID=A0A6L9SFM8_9ACTN|nr:MBL fold metallo-hydrolase [Phytoactinopolyspora halotolerans]NEE04185.1 MBL fold metallo-hydrolase [Phytoactinopolyspora halotolerans]